MYKARWGAIWNRTLSVGGKKISVDFSKFFSQIPQMKFRYTEPKEVFYERTLYATFHMFRFISHVEGKRVSLPERKVEEIFFKLGGKYSSSRKTTKVKMIATFIKTTWKRRCLVFSQTFIVNLTAPSLQSFAVVNKFETEYIINWTGSVINRLTSINLNVFSSHRGKPIKWLHQKLFICLKATILRERNPLRYMFVNYCCFWRTGQCKNTKQTGFG